MWRKRHVLRECGIDKNVDKQKDHCTHKIRKQNSTELLQLSISVTLGWFLFFPVSVCIAMAVIQQHEKRQCSRVE